MAGAQAPSADCVGTSPMNGGGRNDDITFVFPRLRGKWLSVSETEGGALRPGTQRSRKLAKRLRRNMTNAEVKLWVHLRKRDLSGHRFRRQHPVGCYVADFACVQVRLIVEVDGDTHGTEAERRHDAIRTAFLEAQGWTVIRFWNVDVYTNLHGVLEVIAETAGNLARVKTLPPSADRVGTSPMNGGGRNTSPEVDKAINPKTGKDVT